MEFKFYLSLFMRRLPYFLICLALGSALGVSIASVLPPTYVATANLLMEAAQIPNNLATSTVITDPVEQIQVLKQRILTRANLLELANRLEVYRGSPEIPADQLVDDMRKRILINAAVQQTAAGNRSASLPSVLVAISFSSESSVMSATVANEIVTLILQENVEMRTVVAGQTLDFFVQEVDRLEKELSRLSELILKYKDENRDSLPESLDFRRSQQALEQGRLATLERDQTALKDRRAQLVALYQATGQVGNTPGPKTPEQIQLQNLQDQLTNALALLAPSNPRVAMLQSQVDALAKIVASQVSATLVANGQILDPYQVQLADLDAQIKYLDDQRIVITKLIDDLQASISATPGVTLQLDTLSRDYDNVRTQYDAAVNAKARAETGELIETLSKGQRISVLEQAIAPRSPRSPNRPLIAMGGVGAGMGLGVAIVLLLELLNRAIRRPIELTKKLGITPFATLPYMRTRGETARRLALIVLALVIVIGGIPLTLWAVNKYYMPLDQLLDKIIAKLGLTSVMDQVREALGM